MTKEGDQEIRHIFSQLCASRFEYMPLEKKMEVTIQDYDRNKDQRIVRSSKEKDHRIDINEINVFNCIFYRRFDGLKMSAQFEHLIWDRTTMKAERSQRLHLSIY